ncbi:MAG: hypothetical protein V3R63_04490, partial [Alphaproteobacteria bacterium]
AGAMAGSNRASQTKAQTKTQTKAQTKAQAKTQTKAQTKAQAKGSTHCPASAPGPRRAPGWRSQRRPISAPRRVEADPHPQFGPAPRAGTVGDPHPPAEPHPRPPADSDPQPIAPAGPRAGTVAARVYEAYLFFGAMTADECAAAIGLGVLTVRPRCTELRARGLLVASGERRPNRGGRTAAVLMP